MSIYTYIYIYIYTHNDSIEHTSSCQEKRHASCCAYDVVIRRLATCPFKEVPCL